MPQTFNVGARSLFVTTTAWLFIVLAALASVFAVLQNAAVASLMPQLQAAGAGGETLPFVSGLLIAYLPWLVGAGLAVSAATFASAVGLLLRLDWARRVFIGLLAIAIVANLLGLWVQHEVVQALVDRTLSAALLPRQVLGVVDGFVTAARLLALGMTLAACGLLCWIIRRLTSPTVRQEFA